VVPWRVANVSKIPVYLLLISLGLGAHAELRGGALAQEASASQRSLARQLFRQGVADMQGERWDEAREAFQQAYDLVPEPSILLNLASAQVESGRLVEGAESYRQFLREVTSGPLAQHRRVAEEALADVHARIPRVRINIPTLQPGDVVKLDEEPLVEAVLGNELPISPGDHRLTVTREDEVLGEQDFSMAERELREISVELREPAVRVPSAEELAQQEELERQRRLEEERRSRARGDDTLLYVAGGIGAAVVVAAVVVIIVVASGGSTDPAYSQGNWGVFEVP